MNNLSMRLNQLQSRMDNLNSDTDEQEQKDEQQMKEINEMQQMVQNVRLDNQRIVQQIVGLEQRLVATHAPHLLGG